MNTIFVLENWGYAFLNHAIMGAYPAVSSPTTQTLNSAGHVPFGPDGAFFENTMNMIATMRMTPATIEKKTIFCFDIRIGY